MTCACTRPALCETRRACHCSTPSEKDTLLLGHGSDSGELVSDAFVLDVPAVLDGDWR